jgi:mannose-6-phosphate isomerase-like protein (cupin superfamily)
MPRRAHESRHSPPPLAGPTSLTAIELERFVARLAASPQLWRHHVRHAEDLRVYELIWDDENLNAWVICWNQDQDTGFHDHDRSEAAIAVIAGRVREERLRLDRTPCARTFGAGQTFTVPAVAIHRVLHSGDAPAVTIHAYSPPLTRTGAYRTGADGELQRTLLSIEDELRAEVALS